MKNRDSQAVEKSRLSLRKIGGWVDIFVFLFAQFVCCYIYSVLLVA